MPKHIQVRSESDVAEESMVRKLATSRHGPADVIPLEQIMEKSWEGKTVQTIAEELGCHSKMVRVRVARFNTLGTDGLKDVSGRSETRHSG